MSDWMKKVPGWGIAFAPDGRSAGVDQHAAEWAEDVSESERFDALMSLALDDMLSPAEEAEFERMLAGDAGLSTAWHEWQAFDYAFQSAPQLQPPVDFVASFEGRLMRRERRRRLWLGVGVGLTAVAMWCSLVMGLAGAGAYVMFNQSEWLTGAVRVLVQTTATIQSQTEMVVDAASTALATPQVQAMMLAYVVVAMLALWFWARFLRRSVGAQRPAIPDTASYGG